jgi:hypothetical protein
MPTVEERAAEPDMTSDPLVKCAMNEEGRGGTRRARAICGFLIALCVLLGLWLAFAKLVVPPIIESAYAGEPVSSESHDSRAGCILGRSLPARLGHDHAA